MTGPNSTGTSKNLIKGHKEKKKNKSKESERKWLKWKTQKRLNLPPGVSEEENENRLELVFKTIIQEDLKKKRHESTCSRRKLSENEQIQNIYL